MADSIFANFEMCYCGRVLVMRGSSKLYNGVLHYGSSPCVFPPVNQKDNQMEFDTYLRKPFTVKAVEITRENIEEVAKDVGDLRKKENGDPYILVDRRLVPNVDKVYPGFFMTKMGENIRCYSRKIFTDQFMPLDDAAQAWLDYLNGESGGEEIPQAV